MGSSLSLTIWARISKFDDSSSFPPWCHVFPWIHIIYNPFSDTLTSTKLLCTISPCSFLMTYSTQSPFSPAAGPSTLAMVASSCRLRWGVTTGPDVCPVSRPAECELWGVSELCLRTTGHSHTYAQIMYKCICT